MVNLQLCKEKKVGVQWWQICREAYMTSFSDKRLVEFLIIRDFGEVNQIHSEMMFMGNHG